MAANRGEWAELYVLFKLLAEGKIYSADENLNRNANSYLEIIKIIREEVRNVISEYHTGTSVEVFVAGNHVVSIPSVDFLTNADLLLDTINHATGRSFDVSPATETFMNRAHITQVKAKSVSSYGDLGGKNDIVMEIRDHSTALVSVAGFSIKAKGKSPATLFNTAPASAFVYRLTNLNETDMNNINNLFTTAGGKDKNARIKYIIDHDINMEFIGNKIPEGREHSVFADNLDMIRGDMQEIMNEVILIHYTYDGDSTKLSDICIVLIDKNPLHKRNAEAFYTKALKDFLYASFAGMTAGSPWDGREVVNGGYIVAKENGEVLVFHTRDGESFKTFLFNSTKIDRPDASERKGYPYAHVYKENDEYYFDLNFQIRFIS